MGNFSLRLYITNGTNSSNQARAAVEAFCVKHIKEGYEIEVIDILLEPHRAEDDNIIATPTLVKISPAPYRKLIGDFSKTREMLIGLDLEKKYDEGGNSK